MKKTTLALLLLVGMSVSAQKKWSVELNYHMPVGDNVYGDNFTGLLDAGFKWGFVSLPLVRVGASVNVATMYDKTLEPLAGADYLNYAIPIQPRLFAEFSFEPVTKLHPMIALGYTAVVYNTSGTISGADAVSPDTQFGPNANIGLAYDIIGGLFIQVQYDLVKLNSSDEIGSAKYNRTISTVKTGLGLRF